MSIYIKYIYRLFYYNCSNVNILWSNNNLDERYLQNLETI